ncbi:hypothetical protein DL769_010779 [Monosporascus sp. CRB-8-3]|nr:hypothetical protein DL769_010779 [Monosporascus sp. CRB-8-3]
MDEGGVTRLDREWWSWGYPQVQFEEEKKETVRRPRWGELLGGWRARFLEALPGKPLQTESLSRCTKNIWAVFTFLLPSFPVSTKRTTGRSEPHPTAYFDDLRGIAALVVYIFHFGYLWFPFLRDGYGSTPDANMFWQLPIIRVLHSGRGSVTIFFIMSGYVVTAKTVSKIHKRQPEQALHSLSDSLFKHAFRLYIPIIISTLIILALVRLDAFQPDPTVPFREQRPFRSSCSIGRVALYSPLYAGHLWTIPVEFKGSVTVFTLLAFARTRCWIRLAGVLALGCWLDRAGIYEGDLERIQQSWISIGSILFIVALMFSPTLNLLYITWWRRNTNPTAVIAAAAEPDPTTFPPSSSTAVETPAKKAQRPLLQCPFTTRFAQYLRRISYSLYLTHGAVNHTVCVRWLNPAMAAWPRMDTANASDAALARAWRGYCAQALYAALVNTLVLVWVSDLF